MPKLNQILAIEKGAKGALNSGVTKVYHTIQNEGVFDGQDRVYQPDDDDAPESEREPSQTKKVIATVPELLDTLAEHMGTLLDLTATKMTANTHAAADVVVDGKTMFAKLPVEFLLTLEKQLADPGHHLEPQEHAGARPDRRGVALERRYGLVGLGARREQAKQEDPSWLREGAGHRQAPCSGRDVLRGQERRHVDDGQALGGVVPGSEKAAPRPGLPD